jgi:hypothetical protein
MYQIFGILFFRLSVSRKCINVSSRTISLFRYRIFNVTGDVNWPVSRLSENKDKKRGLRPLTPLSVYYLSVLIFHGWQDMGLWQYLTELSNAGAGISHNTI